PEWVVLVVLFWIMTFPDSINVGTAWIMGLVLDALNGSLLGEHALALAAVGYLMAKWQRQLVVFPVWQTAFIVGILIFIYKIIIAVLQGLIGEPPQSAAYGFSILTSLLLWPWVQAVLTVRQPYGAQA
ncbi:MAG: rod shape-determining protein MreD, partial [Gammaproteobacteria bacterium]|nr:rod shape-determining protein MreD [Gammaproteobacteria bacterium]